MSVFNLSFFVANNGSSDLDLRLDFSTDASGEIYYQIDGVNTTSHSFSLNGFGTTTFPSTLFQINTTELATLGETYLILVNLFDSESMQWFATESLLLTYEL